MATADDEHDQINGHPRRCFEEWMEIQAQDLSELIEALDPNSETHQSLTQLCDQTQFKTYVEKRRRLAPNHASLYFAPPWCSPWEISLLLRPPHPRPRRLRAPLQTHRFAPRKSRLSRSGDGGAVPGAGGGAERGAGEDD